MKSKRIRKIVRRTLVGVLCVLLLGIGGLVAWSQIGVMSAETGPLSEARNNPEIEVRDAPEGVVLTPANHTSEVGIVFFPGAKVDPEAYAALFQGVAEQGVTVVIARPLLNLALFDVRPLDSFTSAEPDVTVWAVSGHSLGGTRACQLADDAEALVLLGSYCVNDISDSALPVLSFGGSEDGLSTPQDILDNRHNLPAGAVIREIRGASHASFGDYGTQTGDGTPTISDEEMREYFTSTLREFITDQLAPPA